MAGGMLGVPPVTLYSSPDFFGLSCVFFPGWAEQRGGLVPQQLRQLGDVPPRLVPCEQACSRPPAGLLLEID